MLTLWDMFAQAQKGQGVEVLAQQFRLSQKQMQAALDALLPAFSQALKRNAADPYGLGAFLSAMASGRHAAYFEDAARAFSPQGLADGNAVLAQLFPTEEFSRAVAAQAAQASGIGQEIMKGMLPALAAMMMGGFFKQFTGALGPAGSLTGNPFAEAMAAMMRQGADLIGGKPPAPPPQPAPNPFEQAWTANPWSKAFGEMWGTAKTPDGKSPAPAGAPDNPFAALFAAWMPPAAAASAAPGAAPPPNPFGPMFETGRKGRDDYLRNIDAMFERFAGSAKQQP